MKEIEEGYYWATYKDFNQLEIVEIEFIHNDHTLDGDRYVLYSHGDMIERDEWYKFNFISKVKPPEFPYGRLDII